MKTRNHYQLGLTPEAAARSVAGGGCDWEMEIKRTQSVVIDPDWGYNSPFGVHITNCKRLNSDHVIFAMRVKCLANSAEQRKRDKLADIY
ncbi:MAG: hypothetical protein PHU33_17085 [Bacteroidales bacterium]|nr:hypothetical protein [Bacteroidales bacterium]